jgi:hypothetical protein
MKVTQFFCALNNVKEKQWFGKHWNELTEYKT